MRHCDERNAGFGAILRSPVIVPYGMVFNDDTKNAKSSEMPEKSVTQQGIAALKHTEPPELLMDKTSA
jgi:hypothetical protein